MIGVDQDAEALAVADVGWRGYGERAKLVRANFADAAESLAEPLSGALLDLGVSSHQIDEAARGFSFRPGTPLDMRMAASAASHGGGPAERTGRVGAGGRVLPVWRGAAVAASGGGRGATSEAAPFATSDDLNAVLDASTVLGSRCRTVRASTRRCALR
jgi:hypothetical protein